MAEMVTATNLLPHSARAALTGLRKKGVPIEKRKVKGIARYFISTDHRSEVTRKSPGVPSAD